MKTNSLLKIIVIILLAVFVPGVFLIAAFTAYVAMPMAIGLAVVVGGGTFILYKSGRWNEKMQDMLHDESLSVDDNARLALKGTRRYSLNKSLGGTRRYHALRQELQNELSDNISIAVDFYRACEEKGAVDRAQILKGSGDVLSLADTVKYIAAQPAFSSLVTAENMGKLLFVAAYEIRRIEAEMVGAALLKRP